MAWQDNLKTIGSFVSGVGNFLGGASGLAQPFLSFGHNMALQHDAQDWQERMSNTAHQREVADLQKAGLNPILTATGGSGASTGSVGANQAQGFGSTDGFTQLQNILNNSAQMDNLRANTANLAQDTVLKGTQVLTERQRINNMIQELYESKSREGLNYSKIREIDSNISLMEKQRDALDSTIQLNFSYQNQAIANTNLINNQVKLVQAETKYTNERSRGFSETRSGSSSDDLRFPFGLGGRGLGNSYSHTRTW